MFNCMLTSCGVAVLREQYYIWHVRALSTVPIFPILLLFSAPFGGCMHKLDARKARARTWQRLKSVFGHFFHSMEPTSVPFVNRYKSAYLEDLSSVPSVFESRQLSQLRQSVKFLFMAGGTFAYCRKSQRSFVRANFSHLNCLMASSTRQG